jgi:hypothetical protein
MAPRARLMSRPNARFARISAFSQVRSRAGRLLPSYFSHFRSSELPVGLHALGPQASRPPLFERHRGHRPGR